MDVFAPYHDEGTLSEANRATKSQGPVNDGNSESFIGYIRILYRQFFNEYVYI